MSLNNINSVNTMFGIIKRPENKNFGFTDKLSRTPVSDVFIKTNNKVSEISFKGKTEAVSEPDYTDTKKFGVYFEEKIKTKLKDTTAEEIGATVKKVCERTGSDEDTARTVISRLTQFSGWSQLPALSEEFDNRDIYALSNKLCSVKALNNTKNSLHDVLKYLQNSKRQIAMNPKNSKTAFVADKNLLSDLKDMKEAKNRDFYPINLGIKKGEIKIVLLDGSCCVDENGNDISQGLFGASCSLEDSAVKIISRMQNENKSLDEVLNGEIKSEIKEVFGDDVEICEISNTTHPGKTDNEIAEKMSTQHPSAKEITTIIDTVAEECLKEYPKETQQQGKELLCKYADKMLTCFSSNTVSSELKRMHSQICDTVEQNGKSKDDIIYIIPVKEKSFDLTAYQYAKVNNIPSDKFLNYDGKSSLISPDINGNKRDIKGKTVVILDDITASGNSMLEQCFNYFNFKQHFPKNDVIFAPICSIEHGYKNLQDASMDMSGFKDKIICNNRVDYRKGPWNLNNSETVLLTKLLGHKGYYGGNSCIAMPYMLPDSNCEFSALLLSGFLNRNVDGGNKARKRYQNLEETISKKLNSQDK